MKRLLLLLLFLLSACVTPTDVTPTDVTPTSAATRTPTATRTPEPTPTQEIMMKIGLNTNGQGLQNRQAYKDYVASLCSPQLIMDDLALAVEVYNILKTSCGIANPLVIHRDYSSQEGGECTQTSAATIVNRWLAQGHKEIIRYSVNEPFYGNNWQPCLAREIEVMRRARQNGLTVSMSNFPVGAIQPQLIEAGVFDDYIRALVQYDQYLSVHEYTSAVLSFGVGLWPMQWLNDPNRVAPANWPTINDIPLRRQPQALTTQDLRLTIAQDIPFGQAALAYELGLMNRDESTAAQGALGTTLPTYWHIRRADWFILRAADLGLEPSAIKILITEGSHDHLNDIEAVLTPLEAQYGLADHMFDLRGIPTYCKLWAFYWPQWSCDEAAFQQYKHANEVLYWPDNYKAILIYTCSSNVMWRAFDTCNNSVGRGLISKLATYSNSLRR